jgi:NADH-quinone oxidoreductase subunit E
VDHPREMAIDVINSLQDHYGYFSDEALVAGSRSTDHVTLWRLRNWPPSTRLSTENRWVKYVIHVCDSLICWMESSEDLAAHLCKSGWAYKMGETTGDGLFTLLPVCCIGYCDRAPAILINRMVHGPFDHRIPGPH